jgi:UDP-glucose 4-epimerase
VKSVLVTGGAGFIGAHLVKRLVGEGVRVVVLDDLSWGDAKKVDLPGVEVIRSDVADIAKHAAAFANVSHVFHLAALISAYDSLTEPDPYVATNVLGVLRLIEACSSLNRPKVVFASTSGIYGNSKNQVKRESDMPMPATVYALTKLSGEHLLDMYRERVGYDDVSLRLFNVYGPGQNPKHPYANVTCKFAKAAALGEPVQLYGDGEQTRDFVYVEDVVSALMLVATRPSRHRLYNVGTGTQASIAELLQLAQDVSGTTLQISRMPPWQNDIRAIAADCTRLAEEHGFKPQVSLSEGLRRTVDFFRRGA